MGIKHWTRLSSTLVYKARVFDIYEDRCRSPRNNHEDDYYVLRTSDWVNIIPITKYREVVMVRQYRFGIENPSLEIPGGILSHSEEPLHIAALREMEEETGYIGNEVISLGSVHANPAIMNNRCHFFYAPDVEESSIQNLDLGEDISVELVPVEKISELVINREITHCLVVCAFFNFFASEEAQKRFNLTP